jgi:hypothetical protein
LTRTSYFSCSTQYLPTPGIERRYEVLLILPFITRAVVCEVLLEMSTQHTPRSSREQLCALELELHAKRQRQEFPTITANVYFSIYLATRLTGDRTSRLRHEYEQALKDEHSISSCIEDDLKYHGMSECLSITSMMCHKLPLELRQLIYQFLCVEDQLIPIGPYYHYRPYNRNRNQDSLAASLSVGRSLVDHSARPDPALLMRDNHIFNPEYMGQTVAIETQKAYYANNTFSICNVDQGIGSFLSRSFHAHAQLPFARSMETHFRLANFVRKLQIRIKYEHYEDIRYGELGDGPGRNRDIFAAECNLLRTSKNALIPLVGMLQKDELVELEFIVMTAFASEPSENGDNQRYFINLLEALRNMFYILMYDCGKTKVKVVHHDETISPFPRDITALWSLTKEQWEFVCIYFAYSSRALNLCLIGVKSLNMFNRFAGEINEQRKIHLDCRLLYRTS